MREEEESGQNVLKWIFWGLLGIAVAIGIVYFATWYGPDVIARHDIGSVSGSLRVLRLQQARDSVRGQLITLCAGLFAAGALIFTARNLTLYRENLTLYRRTNEITEQGQVTDRYTRAIEQLGSDQIDVCLGGIYALEHIARDSPRYHPTVTEVLAAFIREHSREPWPSAERGTKASERRTPPVVQTALTVIGRRDVSHDQRAIDLQNAQLRSADLSGAQLSGTNLSGAILTRARFLNANLTGANFSGANLTEAIFINADLSGAILSLAHLNGAYFMGANLTGAGITNATVTGTFFTGANLTGADLRQTDLTTANLTYADLHASNDITAVGLATSQPQLNQNDTDLTGAEYDGAIPERWMLDSRPGLLRRSSAESEGSGS